MTNIQYLTEAEMRVRAGSIVEQVFIPEVRVSKDLPIASMQSNAPFTDHFKERRMVAGFESGVPDVWLDAVASVMAAFGENGCYVMALKQVDPRPPYWYVPLPRFHDYGSLPELQCSIEHAAMSSFSNWAILQTYDYIAMAGTPEIMTVVDRYVLSQDTILTPFLEYWEEGAKTGNRVEWISLLLRHLYGVVEARTVIERSAQTKDVRERMLSAL